MDLSPCLWKFEFVGGSTDFFYYSEGAISFVCELLGGVKWCYIFSFEPDLVPSLVFDGVSFGSVIEPFHHFLSELACSDCFGMYLFHLGMKSRCVWVVGLISCIDSFPGVSSIIKEE